MLKLNIDRVSSLPDDLEQELLPAADAEGFDPLSWLVEEWRARGNRFDEQGEGLYIARLEGRLMGVCGLNRDPYTPDESIGRLRRLYVHPDHRRQGIGRQLVSQALSAAGEHFDVVQLRTLDPRSAAFFEVIGFSELEGHPATTHRVFVRGWGKGTMDV